MSVLDDVFGSLESMSQVQLLLAFIACIGYAFAQGSLLRPRGRHMAWCAAALAAAGFAVESADWTYAAMLLGFAVAGMGGFVAVVWLIGRALGFCPARGLLTADASNPEAGFAIAAAAAPSNPTRATEPAHSL